MLKGINMIYRQQRAPVATTSDFFRAQSNPARGRPLQLARSLGGSGSSAGLPFASLPGCFLSPAAQLWVVLQFCSSLRVLTPASLCCDPDPRRGRSHSHSLCSEPPCHPPLLASGAAAPGGRSPIRDTPPCLLHTLWDLPRGVPASRPPLQGFHHSSPSSTMTDTWNLRGHGHYDSHFINLS